VEEQSLEKIKRNWVAKELSEPKFQSRTVKLKTDYKRIQNNLVKMKFEESEEYL